MLVLHSYAPGVRPADQAPCWEALARLKVAIECRVIDWPCDDEYAYARGLDHATRVGYRVVNVEQDIVPTPEQVAELAECPSPFCAMDYRLANEEYWSIHIDHACLGLAKVTTTAWERSASWPRVPQVHWRDLAYRVSQAIGPAHIHNGPVDHRHGYD